MTERKPPGMRTEDWVDCAVTRPESAKLKQSAPASRNVQGWKAMEWVG